MKIFKNAEFISCEENSQLFKVLAVDDGRIVYTGDTVPEQYSDAQQVDMQGKCIIPSFVDTHIHYAGFALFNAGLDCRDAENFDNMGDQINKYINANPDNKKLLAFGCCAHTVEEKRLPERDDLDRMTSHPLLIVKYDGHAAVGNSALIKKLPSSVLKDEGFDEKTGWFYHNSFFKVSNQLSKNIPLFDLFKNFSGAADYLARRGISLIHAADGVGFPLDIDIDLLRLASPGLPIDIRIFFQTLNVKKALRRKLPRIGGCFKNGLDGCFGSEDTALSAPYTNNPDNSGVLFYPQDTVDNFMIRANRAGLQIAVHAIGDAAIDQALRGYEAALADFSKEDHRHIIIHADLMTDALIEKAAKLGIHIALQTPFLHWRQEPMSYIDSILGDRAEDLIPLKRMTDAGLVLASGSDGPCTLPDPMHSIFCACNHPVAGESVSVIEALRMHTLNGAKLSFDEKDHGSLTKGKLANFTVLEKNPLETPVEDLASIKIEDMYLKGEKYQTRNESALGLLANSFKKRFLKQ